MDATTPKRNEAVARFAAYSCIGDSGVYMEQENGGDWVKYDDYAALQGEVSRLEQRFSDMRKVLFRLHAAYCEVSPNMTRAQRHEGRLALIAATEAMHPQWQGLTNLEPPTDGR